MKDSTTDPNIIDRLREFSGYKEQLSNNIKMNTVRLFGESFGNWNIDFTLYLGINEQAFYCANAELVEGHYVLSENWSKSDIERDIEKTKPNFSIDRYPFRDVFGIEHFYNKAEKRIRELANRRARCVRDMVEGDIFRHLDVKKYPSTN